LICYAIFNTHVAFHYEISDKDDNNNNNKLFVYDLPQLQKISTNWKNISSIYYYTYDEFEHFIFGLKNKNMLAYDALQIFRECSSLKKDHTLTVDHLKHNPEKIGEIYKNLRSAMGPKIKLDLQFEIKRKTRADAIKRRIQDTIGAVSKIKYFSQPGYYKSKEDNNSTEFPFVFEFAREGKKS
jgi:hypothetical protein